MLTKEQYNVPTILVVFGATGDLMAKKIAPALFRLYKNKLLPKQFVIIGFSRRELTEETFREHTANILNTHNITKEESSIFLNSVQFEKGNFDDEQSFINLKKHIDNIEKDWGICTNKLYYLATPPESIPHIIENLKKTKLHEPCGGELGWSRIIVEKPFGSDEKSAKELEKSLNIFKEEQIYRIDHYFGKEMVEGILNFRFSNNLLEHRWNNAHIEKIELRLFETLGVEERGAFYDNVGALRDVGQNHLLEVLALIAMDRPEDFSAQSIRNAREEILSNIKSPDESEVSKKTFRAQYRGYENIKNIKENSQTETYFRAEFKIDHPRWIGVPITIEAGKRMGKVEKEAVIYFKHPHPCLSCPDDHGESTKVIFNIAPKESITIDYWAKKPGLKQVVEKRSFDFLLYKKKDDDQYVEEYAKLLLYAIAGDQTWFVSKKEVISLWKAVDPITRAWTNGEVPMQTYAPDTFDIAEVANEQMKSGAVKKNIGIIGLGKMGSGIAKQLLEKNWNVYGYNRTKDVTKEIEKDGLIGTYSLTELVERIPRPRNIWLMLPAGEATDTTLNELLPLLLPGDTVIDGSNSLYTTSQTRNELCKKYDVIYTDCGVSGGPAGARHGACLMVGGEESVYHRLSPLFRDIAKDGAVAFFNGAGAGHFAKMVHNGIEYGMMQSIAEGFDVLKRSEYEFDLTEVARIYNTGSVIESRLTNWLLKAFKEWGSDLKDVSAKVAHTGEGAWTIETAKKMGTEVPAIKSALDFRIKSEEKPSFAGKILSALRGQFGGHKIK